MTEAANWRDVKAKAHAIDPTCDSDDRMVHGGGPPVPRRIEANYRAGRSAQAPRRSRRGCAQVGVGQGECRAG